MERYPASLDPRILARLSGLQLRARRIVEGYVAGLHRSPHHGFSIEFAEHREYTPGDDLRYLDWKVFARTDKFYLKQYDDETNLIVHLVLDVSESMLYRGPRAPWSKWECAQSLAAALAWLTLKQQDAVGLTTVDAEIQQSIGVSGSPSHLQEILHGLESVAPSGRSQLGPALALLGRRLNRRGVVVVISDLLDDPDQMLQGLQTLVRRQHDVIVLHVLDAAELEFPFQRPTRFHGLEGWPSVTVDPRRLRAAYQHELERHLDRLEHGCRHADVEYKRLATHHPLDVALWPLLASRPRRGANP